MLINQLKPFMKQLITPFQNALIHGGGIMDNVLLGSELIYTIKWKKTGKGIRNRRVVA